MTSNLPDKRRLNGRFPLFISPISALLAWGALLLFTRFVPPDSIVAIVLVVCLITVALTCTFMPGIYLLRRAFSNARNANSISGHSLRESALISICIVFNLMLRVLQSWSIFTTLVSIGIIVVIEILMLGRD